MDGVVGVSVQLWSPPFYNHMTPSIIHQDFLFQVELRRGKRPLSSAVSASCWYGAPTVLAHLEILMRLNCAHRRRGPRLQLRCALM